MKKIIHLTFVVLAPILLASSALAAEKAVTVDTKNDWIRFSVGETPSKRIVLIKKADISWIDVLPVRDKEGRSHFTINTVDREGSNIVFDNLPDAKAAELLDQVLTILAEKK